jgi:hypothetical protein
MLPLPVFIGNPNPTRAVVDEMMVTDGATARRTLAERSDMDPTDNSVPGFASRRLDLAVSFACGFPQRSRNDPVRFGGHGAFVNVSVGWTPLNGKVEGLSDNLGADLGVRSARTISVASTFPMSFRVVNVSTVHDYVHLEPIRSLVRGRAPQAPVPVATASLLFTPKHFPQLSIFQDFRNISRQIHAWQEDRTYPTRFDIAIRLHLANGVLLPVTFPVVLSAMEFSNVPEFDTHGHVQNP